MTEAEDESDFKLKTDAPYLALKDELWRVYHEYFEENWWCYNGSALYCKYLHNITHYLILVCPSLDKINYCLSSICLEHFIVLTNISLLLFFSFFCSCMFLFFPFFDAVPCYAH